MNSEYQTPPSRPSYYCTLLATAVSSCIHKLDTENKNNFTWKHVSIDS